MNVGRNHNNEQRHHACRHTRARHATAPRKTDVQPTKLDIASLENATLGFGCTHPQSKGFTFLLAGGRATSGGCSLILDGVEHSFRIATVTRISLHVLSCGICDILPPSELLGSSRTRLGATFRQGGGMRVRQRIESGCQARRRPACCRRSCIVLATARPQNIVEEVCVHVMADRKTSVRCKPGNP